MNDAGIITGSYNYKNQQGQGFIRGADGTITLFNVLVLLRRSPLP
jgi:hypothetical protein